ncbi:MAG: mechanosensitive ion channel domain-containing protein [Fibrobacteraceae bacterium]
MPQQILTYLSSFFHNYHGLLFLGLAAVISLYVSRHIFLPLFKKIAEKTEGRFDDLLVQYKAVDRFAHIVPAVIIAATLPHLLGESSELYKILSSANNIYFILVIYLVFDSLISAITAYLLLDPKKKGLPLKGLQQAIKLVGFIICLILALSQLTGKSPIILLSGLGALTAVLMLVFKDSILGFVAGIQIATLDLIRTGDWIEIPKQQIDGTVVEVSLTSVRIRNWDNTISVLPAYELVSTSFKNWRSMRETGRRCIQRSILIDVSTIRFLKEEQIKDLLKIQILKPYLEEKLKEVSAYNQDKLTLEETNILANGRHLTNIGTFRAYTEAYLRSLPNIDTKMTNFARQLQSGEQGLPIEIYAFTDKTEWVAYETFRSDIFDHLIAVLPIFGLKLFQNPTGDLSGIGKT